MRGVVDLDYGRDRTVGLMKGRRMNNTVKARVKGDKYNEPGDTQVVRFKRDIRIKYLSNLSEIQ